MLANQRGGSPPAGDPLNSSSFFPAALESTDLILIIYGRHFLLPYLCCDYIPHRFHTSSPLSIGSPPTDLSTLARPVLSSLLQPTLVTSQSCWVLKQRALAQALWKGVFAHILLNVQEMLRSHWKPPLKGFSNVDTCGWLPRQSTTDFLLDTTKHRSKNGAVKCRLVYLDWLQYKFVVVSL